MSSSDIDDTDLNPNQGSLDDNVPPEFLCPITMAIMKDPILMPDGLTYEREAIETALKTNPISPITRQPMNIMEAQTNYTLKKLIDEYIQNVKSKNNETKETNSSIHLSIRKNDENGKNNDRNENNTEINKKNENENKDEINANDLNSMINDLMFLGVDKSLAYEALEMSNFNFQSARNYLIEKVKKRQDKQENNDDENGLFNQNNFRIINNTDNETDDELESGDIYDQSNSNENQNENENNSDEDNIEKDENSNENDSNDNHNLCHLYRSQSPDLQMNDKRKNNLILILYVSFTFSLFVCFIYVICKLLLKSVFKSIKPAKENFRIMNLITSILNYLWNLMIKCMNRFFVFQQD